MIKRACLGENTVFFILKINMWLQLGQNRFLHAQFITYFQGFYFYASCSSRAKGLWLNCSQEEIWKKSLKKFLNDPELPFFFLSRLKAVEIKDEWRCWGKQKQL